MKAQSALEYFMTYAWVLIVVIPLVIIFLVVVPWIFILALNALFTLSIPFNLWTWLAAILLFGGLGAVGSVFYLGRIRASKKLWAFGLIFVIFTLIVGPLLFIWALNTLFLLNIQYTFLTWLAALIVGLVLNSVRSAGSSTIRSGGRRQQPGPRMPPSGPSMPPGSQGPWPGTKA